MTRTVAVAGIIAATLLIAISYVAVFVTGGTPSWAPWAYMVGTVTVMIATTVLGATRRSGGVGRLALPFGFIYVFLLVGFGAALALPAESAGAALWLGLPRRAAIVLYGIGILPLFLLPIAYARTFDAMTLREDDLALVAKAKLAREAREQGAAATRAGEAA